MIAAVFVLALAQEPRRASDLPLHNDATLGLVKELGEEFARGDALPSGSAQAFDAWQRALRIGALDPSSLAPLPDAQGGVGRGGECAELALLRRLRALGENGWRDWRARFEESARSEFGSVFPEESALERFVAAHAGTQTAQRAALRLSDLARERGDEQGARAALERARTQGPLAKALDAALAARAFAPSASKPRTAPKLERLFRAELRPEETRDDWVLSRRAGPALAELEDGSILWWAAGALRTVDARGEVHTVDLPALSSLPDWIFIPPFRDAPSPWAPTLLARGKRAVALLGRARGSDGNLLAAMDFGPNEAATLAWAWGAPGVRLGDPESARVLPVGMWEYQPGACESAGRVYVLARRYASAPDAKPQVDELHAETWCLCLEFATGELVWQRRLGVGADPATRDPARRPEPRGFCAPADPIALQNGRLSCSTGLGWLSILDLPAGRVLGSWRAGLEAEAVGERALLVPPVFWQPAASTWSYRVEPGGSFEFEPADGSLRVAGEAGRTWSIRHADGVQRLETRLAEAGAARLSVALPRGEHAQAGAALGPELLALLSERALYIFDDRDPARLVERVEMPKGAVGAGAILASGERLVCAVGSVLVVFRVRD